MIIRDSMDINYLTMNRLIQKSVLRAYFCKLPKAEDLRVLSDGSQNGPLSDISQKLIQQSMEHFVNAHKSTQLNFSEEENGRTPVLVALEEKTKFEPTAYLSFAFTGLLAFELYAGVFSYSVMGLTSLGIYFFANRGLKKYQHLMAKKISSIYLLSTGEIEVNFQDLSKYEPIVVPKSEFKYALSSPYFDETEGTWCRISGKQYLIPENKVVNQHKLRELLQ